VANLLAFKNVIPPPPAEGLHSSHNGPRLDANVIAPSPNVTRDQSRSMTLNSGIIPPAPNVSSDRSRTVPSLNAGIVAPAPTVQSDHTLFAPRLDSSIIGPAPNVSSNNNRSAFSQRQRNRTRIHARFARSGAIGSIAQRPRNYPSTLRRHARSFSLARANE
jgi:hypothetical protein